MNWTQDCLWKKQEHKVGLPVKNGATVTAFYWLNLYVSLKPLHFFCALTAAKHCRTHPKFDIYCQEGDQ